MTMPDNGKRWIDEVPPEGPPSLPGVVFRNQEREDIQDYIHAMLAHLEAEFWDEVDRGESATKPRSLPSWVGCATNTEDPLSESMSRVWWAWQAAILDGIYRGDHRVESSQPEDLGPQPEDLGPQPEDLGPQPGDLGPQPENFLTTDGIE